MSAVFSSTSVPPPADDALLPPTVGLLPQQRRLCQHARLAVNWIQNLSAVRTSSRRPHRKPDMLDKAHPSVLADASEAPALAGACNIDKT